MTTTSTPDHSAPPPVPDAPYVIGQSTAGWLMHAVAWAEATAAVQRAPHQRHRLVATECGAAALLVTGWGAFTHDNRLLSADTRCPTCGWAVALAQDTIAAELDAIAPDPADLPALTRVLDHPLIAVRLCQAILAAGDHDRDDPDPHLRDLLGHATEHTPTLIVPTDCTDGDCDHRPDDQW